MNRFKEQKINQVKEKIDEQLKKTNNEFKKLEDYQEQLKKLNLNVNYAGINSKEFEKSIGTIVTFMKGAFSEVNKSITNLNNDLNKKMKNSK